MDRIVIGLGTGRCGTRSLAKFLTQNGVKATHERYKLFWNPEKESRWGKIIGRIEPDVAYYWLNYVDLIIDRYPGAKFICLKRKKEAVIASYKRSLLDPIYCMLIKSMDVEVKEETFRYKDVVTKEDLDQMDYETREFVEATWDIEQITSMVIPRENFPVYEVSTNRDEYLSKYYDDYYVKSESLEAKYPNSFKIFDMLHALNTINGNRGILNFIGVAPNTTAQ